MEEKKYSELDMIELTDILDNHILGEIDKFDRMMFGSWYDDWKTCFSKGEQRALILTAFDIKIGLDRLEQRFPSVAVHVRESHRPTIERMNKVIRMCHANESDELAF